MVVVYGKVPQFFALGVNLGFGPIADGAYLALCLLYCLIFF